MKLTVSQKERRDLLVVDSCAVGKHRTTSVSVADADMAAHCVQPGYFCLQCKVSLAAVGIEVSWSHGVPGLAVGGSLVRATASGQIVVAAGNRDPDRLVAGSCGSCFAYWSRSALTEMTGGARAFGAFLGRAAFEFDASGVSS